MKSPFKALQPLPRITKFSLSLLVLNLLLLMTFAFLRTLPPSKSVKISSTQDYLILYGRNSLGFFTLKQFKNWKDLEKYLSLNNLSLSKITHTSQYGILDAEMKENKILWGTGETKKVVLTPDTRSTQVFYDHLRFEGLRPGTFGYSIDLE